MPKEAKVTLDGTEYTIPALNIGQLEDVSAIFGEAAPSSKSGIAILRIAMQRAEPKPDMEKLAPTFAEVGEVVQAVLKLSGLQQPDANPQPEAAKA